MKNERQANAAMSDTLAGRADGPIGHRYAKCSADACGQGRRPCPVPNECHLAEAAASMARFERLATLAERIVLGLVVVAVGLAIGGWLA